MFYSMHLLTDAFVDVCSAYIYILFIGMLVILSRHVNVYYLWLDCWSVSLIPLVFYYMINVIYYGMILLALGLWFCQ